MISDERLGEIVDFAESFGRHPKLDECASMAKEIMAYRQEFSEPVASVYFDSYYGYQASFSNPVKLNNGEFLYRKPTIPEQEI